MKLRTLVCIVGPILLLLEISTVSRPAIQASPLEPQPSTWFVATDGNDTWSGTLPSPNRERTDGPFATLQRARDELRERRTAGGLRSGATVIVHQGTYSLTEPLIFLPEDSGTRRGPITYAAAPGEQVLLKGSRPVAGWKRLEGDVWQADLGGFRLGEDRFWQLFYDGKRQTLARVPNFDPEHPRSGGFLYAAGTLHKNDLSRLPYDPWSDRDSKSQTALLYDPNRLDPAKWSNPSEARVHVWPFLNWNRDVRTIESVDVEDHLLALSSPARYILIEGNRFFVENVREELDAPGEWYYDELTSQLTFRPPDGQCPKDRVSVSLLPKLVEFRGDGKSGRFVQHVHFRGFSLSESEGSLVALKGTAYCTIAACTFSGCRETALTLSDGAHDNRVVGCDIAHVGGAGIVLEGVCDWSHSLEGQPSHNLISNNHVHHVGEGGNAWGAIRIDPSCGGNCTHDNIISHNLVHDTPRQGITFNGSRNVVELNHIHHTNQEQSDTGAIGMGSRDIHELGSIIRHNYVHDTGGYCMIKPGEWAYPHYCWGIYLDDYTSGVHVYGNLIVRAHRGGVMVHGGQDNVIENNVIVDCLAQQIEYLPIDDLVRGRTPAHPDKNPWLMTGTKVVGNIFAYREEMAHWAKGRQWDQILAISDRNLIWPGGSSVTVNDTTVSDSVKWTAWQERGFDAHSRIADPLFVDPVRNDYRLHEKSPARELGFQPIPFERIGVYESPDRASWPVADDCWREEHIIDPNGETQASVRDDLTDQ